MLLLSILEGILGLITVFGIGYVIIYGGLWVFARFFGVHASNKWQYQQTINKHTDYEIELQEYIKTSPEIVESALNNCKAKGYVLTPFNVLSQIRLIEKESNKPLTNQKYTNLISYLKEKFNFESSDSKIDKLERLNKLMNEGRLSEQEYSILKENILYPTQTSKPESSADKVNRSVHKQQVDSKSDIVDLMKKQEVHDAIRIINTLYYEFENELDVLQRHTLTDIHILIRVSDKTKSIILNYNNLFKLYSSGIIDDAEFIDKKKKLIIQSLNT